MRLPTVRCTSPAVALAAVLALAACLASPAADDPADATVFTVHFKPDGTIDYDPSAFDDYREGAVILRGIDVEGSVFLERSGGDLELRRGGPSLVDDFMAEHQEDSDQVVRRL